MKLPALVVVATREALASSGFQQLNIYKRENNAVTTLLPYAAEILSLFQETKQVPVACSSS